MKWCFFSPGFRSFNVLNGDTHDTGGAEAQVAFLASLLARNGHDVSLIYGSGNTASKDVFLGGVRCIDAAPTWRRPISVKKFWFTLRKLSPEFIYARLPSDFLWLLGAAAHFGDARFVYSMAHDGHCRPMLAYTYKRWLHGPLFAAGLSTANSILVQHAGQFELAPKKLRARLALVPNLLIASSETPRSFDAAQFDAIWVAKIRSTKRLEMFLDLARATPDLHFAVVGGFDPETPQGYRDQMSQLMSQINNVTYTGPLGREQVLQVIANTRVLVNTSLAEGFPNTMLEAWSQGVPVASLGVDPGGVVARHGLGLVSTNPDALRDDIITLARDPETNRAHGERGYRYVRERHSPEVVLSTLAAAVTDHGSLDSGDSRQWSNQ